MTPTAPVVPATIRRCGLWATGWSASCTAAWPIGWPTRSSWPGQPPSRPPEQRSGGAGGCNPPAILAAWIARGPAVQVGQGCREVKRDGTAGFAGLVDQTAAEGGTTQPASSAACLDRA
jgi:hypothetical protein